MAEYDCYNDDQRKCSDEHRQLAEWLRELKRLRESATDTDTISRQAAIDTVREAQEWFGAKETSEDCFAFEACEEIIEAISNIPYADMRGGES